MTHLLMLESGFYKAHGHGNDYLVFREGSEWAATPSAIQLVCHPHRGPGGDGIVALLDSAKGSREGPKEAREGPKESEGRPKEARGRPFALRMFNPDGSEFERSGNGLRVLGAYLYQAGHVALMEPFAVEVGGDRVILEILEESRRGFLDVAVDMGSAAFGAEAVGGQGRIAISDTSVSVPLGDGDPVEAHPVSVGNPHCVLFREELEERDLLTLGPALTSHPAFPAGVNVQLATVRGEASMEILIWERGVGRTASSGTSACAVAAAAVRSGRLGPGRIQVEMEGGSFYVTVSPTYGVRLEGPVQPVCKGRLTEGFLSSLRRSS